MHIFAGKIYKRMKTKHLLLLIIFLLSFGLVSCDDKDDASPVDLQFFDGVWEVVDQGSQNVLLRGCFLDIAPYYAEGPLQGRITTFYMTVGGAIVHDKAYYWNVRRYGNELPLLDLTWQADIDSDDLWDGNYFYTITLLNDTHMCWQVRSNGDQSTVKFRRRTDITLD